MKISNLSTVLKLVASTSILSILGPVQADEAYGILSRSGGGGGTPRITYGLFDKAKCGTDSEVINTFKTRFSICYENEIWKNPSKLKDKLPALLDGSDGEHLYILFTFLSRYVGVFHKAGFVMTNEPNWKRFAELFTNKSLEKLPTTGGAPLLLAKLLVFLKPEQTLHLNTAAIKAALLATRDAKHARLLINNLHQNVVKEMFNDIVEFLQTPGGIGEAIHLGGLSETILKKLLTADYCSGLAPSAILTLGEREKQAALMTPECMAEIDWSAATCDRRLRAFNPKVFSLSTKNMSQSCLDLMTRPMVEIYGTADKETGRCTELAIEKLNNAAIRGVDGECLINRLNSDSVADRSFSLASLWPLLPSDVFSKIRGNESALDKIVIEDFGKMTHDQKNFLVQSPATCEHLPSRTFLENGEISVPQNCFDNLSSDAKAAAVVHSHLPNDALAKIASLKDWHLPKDSLEADATEVEGIHILEHIRAPNAQQLIENLSAADPESHACRDIETLSMLNEMPTFQEYCSEACVKALGEKPKLTTLKEVSERIAKMIPLKDLLEEMNTSDWQSLEIESFNKVLNAPGFCEGITSDQLNAFNPECLKAIGPSCAAAITVWGEADERAVKEMKPEAFRKFNGTLAASLGVHKLNDEQFAQLGADMPPENHPAAVWDKDMIAALSPTRLALVSKEAWKAMRPEAFEGISADQLRAIKPGNMVLWRANQVAKVVKEHWNVLSPEQAQAIGSGVTGEDSPLAYLETAPLNEKAMAVIKERQKPSPKAEDEAKAPEKGKRAPTKNPRVPTKKGGRAPTKKEGRAPTKNVAAEKKKD